MEMDIMGIIQQFAIIPVAAACFLFGWLLKNVWEGFPNKYIPLVLLPIALVGVLWLNGWEITPENIMAGICSAALAVYAHQTGKHLVTDSKNDSGVDSDSDMDNKNQDEKAEPGGGAE